jgi:ribosomal protein L37AE/L43A
MEGLKPPYLVLSNHMYFVDFELASVVTFPHKVNNVINIDGYIKRSWLMRLIGGICTRKFSNDLHLIKSVKKVIKRGDVVSIYPEARYSPCGITSYIPESLGKLVKMCKVPVVVIIHHGNHLMTPFWNFRKPRKVPLYTRAKLVLTKEQIEEYSVEKINEILKEEFIYDDYKYQKENNILIKEKYRAEGMHKILYQCPNCKTEFKMESEGNKLWCTHCGKAWEMDEYGVLKATEGETEFSHIPDWYNWEKENVRREVAEGTYSFEDEVDVYSLPHMKKFIYLGNAKFKHSRENGVTVEGHYNGEDYKIHRPSAGLYSIHTEYDYLYLRPATPVPGRVIV